MKEERHIISKLYIAIWSYENPFIMRSKFRSKKFNGIYNTKIFPRDPYSSQNLIIKNGT